MCRPYIKLFDLRAKAQCCNVYGRMANKVLPFLLATHSISRPIFFMILPDGDEANASQTLRAALCKWADAYAQRDKLKIITSTEPRTMACANALADATAGPRPEARPNLAPLQTSRDAMGQTFSTKFGESVADLVVRLEPIVLELEGAVTPVIVIAQEAPCRTLRAYVAGKQLDDISQRDAIDPSFDVGGVAKPQLTQFAFNDEAGVLKEDVIALGE